MTMFPQGQECRHTLIRIDEEFALDRRRNSGLLSVGHSNIFVFFKEKHFWELSCSIRLPWWWFWKRWLYGQLTANKALHVLRKHSDMRLCLPTRYMPYLPKVFFFFLIFNWRPLYATLFMFHEEQTALSQNVCIIIIWSIFLIIMREKEILFFGR